MSSGLTEVHVGRFWWENERGAHTLEGRRVTVIGNLSFLYPSLTFWIASREEDQRLTGMRSGSLIT